MIYKYIPYIYSKIYPTKFSYIYKIVIIELLTQVTKWVFQVKI